MISSSSLTSQVFDVAVIGAGPAGAAAARLLASWGHSVVMLGRPPRRRAMAESLPPSCDNLFVRLGVRGTIDGASFVRATGNTVQWGDGARRVEPFAPDLRGYQVERGRFDSLLLESARAEGATMYADSPATAIERDGDRWRIGTDGPIAQEEIRAYWVLDCSGRAGLMARRGLRQPRAGDRTTAVAGIWERADPWRSIDPTHTLVESYESGWAWSIPVAPTRRYVTVMLDPAITSLASRRALATAYLAELARTTLVGSVAHDATLAGEPWACDASPYTAIRAYDERVLLVGDAASFVDPLSSFGVKKALVSAWRAAVVVHTAFVDPPLTSSALALHDDRERVVHDTLRRAAAQLARVAADRHDTAFWSSRADHATDDASLDGEESRRRGESITPDPRALAAIDELRRRSTIALRAGPALGHVDRATIRGNRVVLEEHLVNPLLPDGVRYWRNVDLLIVARLAPHHDQVPALFEAYNRAAPPAALPDFLSALSTLVGFELLTLA